MHTSEPGAITPTGETTTPRPPALITAIRQWAGFPLDQLCASCECPFYNRDGLPVCYGCRRDAARASLLGVLARRRDGARRIEPPPCAT